MLKIKEAIIVEGRYDKNSLSQVVDGLILETSGFGVFKDGEKLELIRRLAQRQGIIVLTDSDGAGFVIRNYLKGAIPKDQVKHAYIPDVYGKERRKRKAGKEGKLGVEGMNPEVLRQALLRAGATVVDGDPGAHRAAGLGGTPGEAAPPPGAAPAHEQQGLAGYAQRPAHPGRGGADGGGAGTISRIKERGVDEWSTPQNVVRKI